MLAFPLLLGALASSAPSALTLDGRRVGPSTLQSTVALFWRVDCAPCLAELADLQALRKAAAPLQVRPVALEESPGRLGPVAEALAKVGLQASETLRAQGAPEALLTAYGGSPPRLPLAVAFDRAGRVCGRHTGVLGYDQLRGWAGRCGGGGAARR